MSGDLRSDRTVLANGLTLLGEHNPGAQTVAAGYFVRTGARDETAELAGVSHFLEHMMFKGTDRRSADDINREFDELGARYNAYTSEDRTVYFGAVLPERAPGLIDLLSDMMRPTLRQDDFDVEKSVILEEIAMYEDRPGFRLFDLANPRYFGSHPVGNLVLGTTESIGALERDAMAAYHRARYAPNNLVFVLTGRYDWERVVAQVEEATAAWVPQPSGRERPPFRPEGGHHGVEDAGLSRVHLAAFAPGVASDDPLRHAASLVASCLGASGSGALHWALVDPGLVDSAGLWHEAADGLGTFVGYVSTDPERYDEVAARFREVLSDFERDGPTADAWHRAQRRIATGLTLRAETPFGRLMSLGGGFLDRGRYEPLAGSVAALLAAERDEGLALLAERPLSQLFTVALGPGRGA